jgi:hypothetical protein
VSERTRKEARKIRRDIDISTMILIIESYLDMLDYKHPPVRSEKFKEVSYSRASCEEILGLLKSSGDLPFETTALDILEQYVDKMKHFAADHEDKKHSECFAQAAFIGEYFIEQYWFNGLGEG